MNKELCIMPKNNRYKTERFEGSHRHEVFYAKNRQKSIEDGLVIFLTPQEHNMSNYGIHFNPFFDKDMKKLAQQTWQDYYHKTTDEFRQRYGKNYL